MINPISFDNTSPVIGKAFSHCVESSDLGLRPGEWPTWLNVDPKFGNGQPLRRTRVIEHNGELGAVVYRQRFGVLEVRVLND